jgi:hypothetical protein
MNPHQDMNKAPTSTSNVDLLLDKINESLNNLNDNVFTLKNRLEPVSSTEVFDTESDSSKAMVSDPATSLLAARLGDINSRIQRSSWDIQMLATRLDV